MVLEALYNIRNLKSTPKIALFLGFVYTLLGIGLAYVIFRGDIGLASVAFTSLLILPSLQNLATVEESTERESRSLGLFALLKDNKVPIKILMNFFLGSFFAYLLASLFISAPLAPAFFESQLGVVGSSGSAISGFAFDSATLFNDILINNLVVLAFSFLVSFMIGSGGIFFVIWNASVWGVAFGHTAVLASAVGNQSPVLYLAVILGVVMVFVVLEALGYVLGMLSGSVLSRTVLNELRSKEMTVFHKYAALAGVVSKSWSQQLLDERWYAQGFKKVVIVNLSLLSLAVITILASALIESWILQNADIYSQIVAQSMGI